MVLNIMKGIKTGSKYYVFNIGVENRVKIFREKTQENLGMKTWIHQLCQHFMERTDFLAYQRYRKAYNIIFLMENSIVKKFGSVDVKITPDFCS